MKPWRMFRARGGTHETLAWDLAVRGTLTFCKKECPPEERTYPYGNIHVIWVGDDGVRVVFDTSHIENLDVGDLPRRLSVRDVHGVIRVFEVYKEIPVTGEQIRMTVVSVSANPRVK